MLCTKPELADPTSPRKRQRGLQSTKVSRTPAPAKLRQLAYSKLLSRRNTENSVLTIQLRDIIEDGASVLDNNLNLNVE
jgi:hypothetical protein